MSLIPDIAVTTVYFTFTLLVVEVIRRTIRLVLLSPLPLVELCIEEFLAAFELCAICYEINILLEYSHGVFIYAFFLFLASAWWGKTWGVATASPHTYVADWLFEGTPLPTLLAAVSSQILGGMIFYQCYIKHLWSLGYGDLHFEKVTDTSICYSDIQAPVIVAAMVEAGGVCACALTAKLTSAKLSPNIATIVDSFVSTALVVAAMNVSGGYYNSVLASAILYGCFGSTALEHFSVYWLGAIAGAILAHLTWENLHSLASDRKPKSD